MNKKCQDFTKAPKLNILKGITLLWNMKKTSVKMIKNIIKSLSYEK